MEGRVTFSQALLRFLACMVVAWLFMYLVPIKWFLTYFLPMSFFLLMGTVTFGVCGLGWPLAAPMGKFWKPDNRLLPGILMTVIWIVLAVILAWIEANVWPKIPLFPAGLWFGIGVFGITLWYTFDGAGPHPFKQAWANWLFASVLILVLAGIIFSVFVNFNGTPLESHPSNPNGFFPGPWWFGFGVWVIVWIQVFGSPMCLQGWPFYKLGTPFYQITLAIACVVLGYICWAGSLALGMSPTFSFGAIGASAIGWSLMHSIAFELAPFAKYAQPKRGVFNFILEEVVLVAVWILVLRVILAPIYAKIVAAGFGPVPFDINAASAFFTLHVTAVVLLVHHFFFMRAPLSIPGPPLGPEEIPPE